MTPSNGWIGTGLDALRRRIDETAAEDDTGFPHIGDPVTGDWTRSPAGDWTGGFWNGLLWLAAATTDDSSYRTLARDWTERMIPRKDSETIFRGFLFWYGAAIGDVLLGDSLAREVATDGARGLAGLYNPAAQLIPLGDQAEEASSVGRGEANIDGVPGGTPLLSWAARNDGASEWSKLAAAHAERHIELCVRADGSVCQSASFDPTSGDVLARYTHKGISDDSTWTRAQAWAMLGFAQAAIRCDRDRFLPTARKVADWWVEHLPDDAVTYWDFDAPQVEETKRDTSGTAIGATALLKLAQLIPDRADAYRDTAMRSAHALVNRHLSSQGALIDSCYNYRIGLAVANELIWGDYFLYETLNVLSGRLDPTVI